MINKKKNKTLNDILPDITKGLDTVFDKEQKHKEEVGDTAYMIENLEFGLVTGDIKHSASITFNKDTLISDLEKKGYDMDPWK